MQADHTEFQADRSSRIAAGAAVAGAGMYVSVFVMQALPQLARAFAGDAPWRLRQLVLWIVLGGLLGSVLGAWRFRLVGYQRQLGWCFRGAAAVAAVALMARDWPILVMTALFSGVAAGWLWVVLLGGLRASAGTPGLGLIVGGGWAFAWMLAGLVGAIAEGPRAGIVVTALIAGSGSLTAPFLTPQEPSVSPWIHYRPAGVLRWTLVFGGLMALAAAVLVADVPTSTNVWWAVPAISGALLAGWVYERGWTVAAGAAAGALLLGAHVLGLLGDAGALMALLGMVGIAMVPVAWMCHVARGGRVWQVASMATVAGWGAAYGAASAVSVAPAQATGITLAAAGLALAGMLWRPGR